MRLTLAARPATARAIARHGLNALKMSPTIALSRAIKTQNATKTNVGTMLLGSTCVPAKPA